MKLLAATVLSFSLVASASSQTITITRSGSQPSRPGPAENFTGSVRVDPWFQATAPARTTGALVTFEPGARSAWHTHSLGQTLIVTAGIGRVQQWGAPIDEIRQGDVVWIPPNQKHWHGAAPNSSMAHIAIVEQLDGKSTDWMEKVSDAQYGAPVRGREPSAASTQPTPAQRLIGDFSPKLVDLTDRVLFGEVWARPQLSQRDRSLRARTNGVTQEEVVETITHLAFYSGWPNAITAISVAKEVFTEGGQEDP